MSGQLVFSLEAGNLAFHDAQLDYYGKRAAAACGAPVAPDEKGLPDGDYTVYIWDITDGQQQKCTAQLKGHEGPVWKVAWAHPQFGSLLATCSYDMKIIIWKEVNGQWQKAYVDTSHTASVNDVEFCPWEHGLRLASASSDGTVSVLTYSAQEAQWRRSVFNAHVCGAQSVSWAPAVHREGAHGPAVRLATGGCDNSVRIWKCENDTWTQENQGLMPSQSDWVREVAWRPDVSCNVVASGSWDKTVVIWKQELEGQPWRQVQKIGCAGKVEGLAWSVTGSLLAVAVDDGETVIYREGYDGRYEAVANCNEAGYTETAKLGSSPISGGAFDMQNEVSQNAQMDQQQAAQQQSVLDAFGM